MIARILNGIILFVSSFFRILGGRACRFHPSCSVYARQALRSHRAARALRMIAGRLSRCHPFSAGGYDPVSPGR